MKFTTGRYEYITWSTGRKYEVEIVEISNGYANCIIDGAKEKSFKIYTVKDGANKGNEYIEFRGRNHDALVPSDKVEDDEEPKAEAEATVAYIAEEDVTADDIEAWIRELDG